MQTYSKTPAMLIVVVSIFLQTSLSLSFAQNVKEHDYLLLATNRTSTMETEMQEAADEGISGIWSEFPTREGPAPDYDPIPPTDEEIAELLR